MSPTRTNQSLAVKVTGFSNLVEALEYAAQGETGFNFYDGRGKLATVLSYSKLRDEAEVLARRLLGLGCERGARVGIIAETEPMFHRFFFACQYAGLIPVALPAGIQLGAHGAYVGQVRRMLKGCGASLVVAPDSHAKFMAEAVQGLELTMATLPVSTAIVGCSTVAEVEDNVELARNFKPFSDDEMKELEALTAAYYWEGGFFKWEW